MTPQLISILITENIKNNNGLIYENLQQQLPHLIKQLQRITPNPEQLIHELSQLDPTEDKTNLHQLTQWVINKEIRWPEDKDKLQQTIKDYEQLRKQHPEFRKITKYQSYHNLTKDIDKHLRPQELKKQKRIQRINLPGTNITDKPPYTILTITNPESAVKLASGTKWCTSNINTASDYLSKGPLYVILKDGRKYAQAHLDPSDPVLKDISDEDLKDSILGKVLIDNFGDNNPGLYIGFMVKAPKEVEGVISKNPEWAYGYARHVVGGRWPEGEEAISKKPYYAYLYAKDVVKCRWPEGEGVISKEPELAFIYARHVVKGRWPEGEGVISKNPKWAYFYAKYVVKGRWPEGEEVISKDPDYAYYYALNVVKGRWPEGEEVINKDPDLTYNYAKNVVKGRWPEGKI